MVAVAKVYSAITGQHVQILPPFNVPEPRTFTSGEYDVKWSIVWGGIPVIEVDMF
jgi:hypothetical protein